MSTSVPTDVPNHPGDPTPAGTSKTVDHIRIIGHSNLLYWWPVWLVSFILAAVTYLEQNRMVVVPDGTQFVSGATVTGPNGTAIDGPRDVVVAPAGKPLAVPADRADGKIGPTVTSNNSLGVVFAVTLLVVAMVSTLTLRGLVSLLVIVGLIAVAVTLALLDLWNPILMFFGGLDIRMNAAGYLFIAVPLFLLWVFAVFVYDRQIYMVFDEGQIRYVLDVGDSAMVAPSEGAIVEKKRDDVFRHWLLGFGTGDIVVKTGDGRKVELENVIGIGRKLTVINDMLRHKPIVVESA